MSNKLNVIGEEITGRYGHMAVIAYRNSKDLDVKFDNGYIAKHHSYRTFKNGGITNPFYPSVCNVGYYGIGKYVAKVNGQHTKEYLVWRTMLVRCYQNEYQRKHPTYKDCYVCDEWLNFQNFAEWFHDNYYEIDGEIIDLDKDFISMNNKRYSPETCIFIPQAINKQILCNTNKISGLPHGVIYDFKNHGIYIVKCRANHKDIYVGRFTDINEAYDNYIIVKNNILREMIKNYGDALPCHVKNILNNFIESNKLAELYMVA